MSEMRLYDDTGSRLYLNADERAEFLAAARKRPPRDRTLCETLLYTGCRPSELVAITPARIDLSANTVTIQSLKKRKDSSGRQKIVFRAVPVPEDYLDTLNTAHGIREAQKAPRRANKHIFDLTRMQVWRIVKSVMVEAGIPDAPHRTAKGLRHAYGINCLTSAPVGQI